MENRNNIEMIATFHYVMGGIKLFASLFVLIYVFIGAGMFFGGMQSNEAELQISGGIFFLVFVVAFLMVAALGVCSILCGKYLKEYRNRMFCMVIAALDCMNAPLGTVLGIFTIMEIEKPEIKKIFEDNKVAREAAMRKAGL